jgi:hypothetical protein
MVIVQKVAARPVSPAIRASMETAFGRDFSQVRIHTGATSERSATALGIQPTVLTNRRLLSGSGQRDCGSTGASD